MKKQTDNEKKVDKKEPPPIRKDMGETTLKSKKKIAASEKDVKREN